MLKQKTGIITLTKLNICMNTNNFGLRSSRLITGLSYNNCNCCNDDRPTLRGAKSQLCITLAGIIAVSFQ